MTSKQKITTSVISIILVLAVIGLTIAIVLVASSIQVSNSMSVSYKAINVSCDIESSATLYSDTSDDEGTPIDLVDSTKALIKIVPEDDELTSDEGKIEFEKVEELLATGRAVYKFKITNTATVSPTTKALTVTSKLVDEDGIELTIDNITATNINVQIGEDEASALSGNKAVISYTEDEIPAGEYREIVIVLTVANTDLDAEISFGLQLLITQVA